MQYFFPGHFELVFGKKGMRAHEYPMIWTPGTEKVWLSLSQVATVVWELLPLLKENRLNCKKKVRYTVSKSQ